MPDINTLADLNAALARVMESLSPMISLFGSTLMLVLTVVIVRLISARFIRRNVASLELRRRWLIQSRNGLLLLLLLGLLMIWGEELRTLALSIVALAVAFVVATKELILCVSGSILKTGSRAFNLGDRIQIKELRGDVIDQNLLATTILEVGPGKISHQRTGRVIIIPNAMFVSEALVNENFSHEYVLHVFTVPFKRTDKWREAQQAFLASAQRHCQPYLEDARRYMERLGQSRGLDVASVDPRVTLQVPAAAEIHLLVRFPARANQRNYMEQLILAEVFGQQDFCGKRSADDDKEKD